MTDGKKKNEEEIEIGAEMRDKRTVTVGDRDLIRETRNKHKNGVLANKGVG